MIYLIAKIFVYLLFAMALGVAAGWLWRDRQAAGREAVVERQLMESRSHKPLEAAMRSQDRRLEVAQGEVALRDQELALQAEEIAARDKSIAELERACAALREQLDTRVPAAAPPPVDEVSARAVFDDMRRDLENALAASRDELARAQRALAAEKRRVEELGQERELQRRSLHALEQQLEMAREGQARIANG